MVGGGRALSYRFAALTAVGLVTGLAFLAALAPQALASGNVNWAAGVQAQLPADAGTSGQLGVVNSISCPSAGDCTAVGQYKDASNQTQGLLLTETAALWGTGVGASLPADASSDPQVTLTSVSCASAGNCTAVGYYASGSGGNQGLLLTESAGTWTSGIEAPLPADAGPGPNVVLRSVSCSSPGDCTAVGDYDDSSSSSHGLLLTQTDGTWQPPVEAPLPNDASANAGVTLDSVACSSAGSCTAVGNFNDSSSVQGLLLTETAGSWATGLQAPLPNDSNARPVVSVQSVSCASSEDCTAVGFYLDSSGNNQGLLLTESAGTWATGVKAPLPPNASQSPVVSLPSVSCTSVGDCTAVGTYSGGSTGPHGLLLTETGGSWESPVEAPLPAGASMSPQVSLPSVSCASPGDCSAVGQYQDNTGNLEGVLLTESGNAWATGVEAALPAGAASDPNTTLNSVSCDSANSCSTVGFYEDGSINFQGVIISASPTTPTLSVSSPAAAIAGSDIPSSSLAANLSGGTSPTGTITFTVFGPQQTAPTSCTSGGTTVGTATLSGNGSYNPSSDFAHPTTGTYWWYASYGGDPSNSPIDTTCGAGMASTVVRQAPTTLTASAPTTDATTNGVHPDAILSGATSQAGGTVTFTVFGPQTQPPVSCTNGGTTVGSSPISGNGTYNPGAVFTPATPGTYWWYASYSGDADNTASTSTCGLGMTSTTVTNASTLAGLWPNTATMGSAIPADTMGTVLSGTIGGAGGTITFTAFGPQDTPPSSCDSGGTTIGTASVSGDGSYVPNVDFTPSAPGLYFLYASYSGDLSDSPSNTTCGAQMVRTIVTKAPTTLTAAAPGTTTVDSPVTGGSISSALAGAVNGAAGTITFTVFGPRDTPPSSCTTGGTTVGSAPVSGNGTYSPVTGFTPGIAGTYWWYATYDGDSDSAASNSICGAGMASTVVSKLIPSLAASAPNSGAVGTPIAASSISGLLSGAANAVGGTITFTVFGPQSAAPSLCSGGGKGVGSAPVSGNGTYTPSAGFTPAAAGTYWWYASYGGDPSDTSAASTCGAPMAKTVVVLPPPKLSNLKQSHTKWQLGSKLTTMSTMKLAPPLQARRSASKTPVGTAFTFTLNESATVKLVFTHLVHGRTVTTGTLSLSGHAGNEMIAFQGRLSKTKRLAPGSYTVTFTASSSARQVSPPQQLRFTAVS